MANHLSALKRARQTERRTARNRANTSQLRTALRKFRQTLQSGKPADDKAVKKGVIHKNTAARYKSRLSARVAGAK
jgi:small subunit ribosomal protein S20